MELSSLTVNRRLPASRVDLSSSPTPGLPVDVDVEVNVKAIQQIDPKCGTSKVIFGVRYLWCDPRVAKACEQDPLFRVPSDLCKPGLKIPNGISEQQFTVHDAPEVCIISCG